MRTRATLLLLAAMILMNHSATATEETPFPAAMPALGTARALPTPTIDQSRTPEGVTLWIVKHSITPKATVMLVVRGGEAADPPGLIGLSDVLVSTVNEGTTTRSAQQISDALQAVGARFECEDTRDGTYLTVSGLAEGTDKMLELVADMARRATFPDAEVTRAKTNLISEYEESEGQPGNVGRRALSKVIFGEHPYAVLTATPAVINKVTPALLRETLARRFRPERALLIVAGDVDPARVKKDVARAFAGWKGVGPAEPPPPPLPSSAPGARRIYLLDRPGSVQSHIEVGVVAPQRNDPQYYALWMADQVYGGGFTGRLIQNVREDKGYSYHPASRLEDGALAGLFSVTLDVRSDVTAAALVETLYELDRMWATPVTDKELTRAKRLAAGQFAFRNQIAGALASTLGTNWLLGLPPEEIGRVIGKLNAVTVAQIQQASAGVFPSQAKSIVIVGDKPKIIGALSRLGTVIDLK